MSSTTNSMEGWFADFIATETTPEMTRAWVDRTADAILAETPEVAEDGVLAQLLRSGVHAHWVSFLGSLAEPTEELRLPKAAVEFAAGLAQRQLHLATLFKVYRIAQQTTWRYVTEVIRGQRAEGVDDAEVLVHFWGRASAWIDYSVTASVDVYQAERDRQLQGAAAERLEWVRRALDGLVEDTKEFSARLGGYPVSAYNTAFVIHTDDTDAVAELERVATQFAADLGSRQPLVVAPGGRELWGWVGTRSQPDLRLLKGREEQLREQGITAYVGTPGEGIDGFAVSHRESREAQRIALQAGQLGPLTLFPDVELLSLVSQTGDSSRRFAERTLGQLAEPTETAQRLRETVLALLSSGSVDEASRLLLIHKNTVRYRVGQAESILGHPIMESPVELGLALRFHATFLAGRESS